MTDETNTTPGPWHVDKDGWVVSEAEDFAICLIDGSRQLDEFDPIDRANATLIIAAPEMFEALITVSELHFYGREDTFNDAMREVKAAIAKALGRSK